MASELRLPPFPNELVERGDKEGAIMFLISLRLPADFARAHLRRFAKVSGVTVTAVDYGRLGPPVPAAPEVV